MIQLAFGAKGKSARRVAVEKLELGGGTRMTGRQMLAERERHQTCQMLYVQVAVCSRVPFLLMTSLAPWFNGTQVEAKEVSDQAEMGLSQMTWSPHRGLLAK